MREIIQTAQFKRDVKLAQKRHKDMSKLREVYYVLASGEEVPAVYKDHPLTGNWKHHRDLHLEPDWLLIYKVGVDTLTMVRTGTHSDLF
jgi:mRNA interferase YafQ